MKFLILALWVLSVFCLGRANAETLNETLKGKVYFVDPCSGRPSSVATPNGSQLMLDLHGLNPSQELDIQIHYQLSGVAEDVSRLHAFEYHYRYDPGTFESEVQYRFRIPKNHELNGVEKKLEGSRIWQATVTWTQGGAFGQSFDVLYRPEKLGTFFRASSGVLCRWTTPPAVSSEYHYNQDQPSLLISRKVIDASQIGLNHEPDPMNPMTSPESVYGIFGYYFNGRDQESYLNQALYLERSWTLYRFQGGVFADHYAFSRIRADELEWKERDGSCGEFEKKETGYLDIGALVTEFYSVPRSLSGSPDQLNAFLRAYLPVLDTCSTLGLGPPSDSIPGTGLNSFLFHFNPVKPNPNQE